MQANFVIEYYYDAFTTINITLSALPCMSMHKFSHKKALVHFTFSKRRNKRKYFNDKRKNAQTFLHLDDDDDDMEVSEMLH